MLKHSLPDTGTRAAAAGSCPVPQRRRLLSLVDVAERATAPVVDKPEHPPLWQRGGQAWW